MKTASFRLFGLGLLFVSSRAFAQIAEAVDATGLHRNSNIEVLPVRDCFGPGENSMPIFIGGDTALIGFLNRNIHWPDSLYP
ncbi:hypothetical protein ABIB60_001112 [Hymenobacter sp. UYP22]